jgi:hypothetical protein
VREEVTYRDTSYLKILHFSMYTFSQPLNKWKGLGKFMSYPQPSSLPWPWWRYTTKAAPEDTKGRPHYSKFQAFLVDKKLNHGDACAVHGGCNSYNASGTVCRDAGCTCELRWATADYTPALQPTGFLSRLGAEGSDKEDAAHQVVMWFGTAGSEWKNTDMIKLQVPWPSLHYSA